MTNKFFLNIQIIEIFLDAKISKVNRVTIDVVTIVTTDVVTIVSRVTTTSVDGTPLFRPILSALGTPTCKLAKFFVPLLERLTYNHYTIKDSFSFCEELRHFNTNLIMASFDVESLFTNIPLQ